MTPEQQANARLISLKIAMKMHNSNYTTKDGKISSTELLKTADEIHKWIWSTGIAPESKDESKVDVTNIDSSIRSVGTCLNGQSPLDQLLTILKRQIELYHYNPSHKSKQYQLLAILEDLKGKE